MAAAIDERTELTVAMFFFILLMIVGVIFCGATVRDYARARASPDWPVVEGVILSGEKGVRYAYAADGRKREGRRVRFLTAGFARGAPALSPGETAPVSIDPKDNAVSVLEPGGSGPVFAVYLAVSALLAFVGAGGLIRTLTVSRMREMDGGAEGTDRQALLR